MWPARKPNPKTALTVGYFWQLEEIREQLAHQIAGGTYTGREVTLDYDQDTGRLTQVTSHDNRRVIYSHDESGADHFPTTAAGAACGGVQGPCERGNLAEVTGAHPAGTPGQGIVETYRYPETPDFQTSGVTRADFEHIHNLTHYTLAAGVEARIATYDPVTDEVSSQVYGNSSWTYAYVRDTSGTTTTIDRTIKTPDVVMGVETTATTIYSFNPDGFLTRKQDALGHVLTWDRASGSAAGSASVFESLAAESAATPSRVIEFTYHSNGNVNTQKTQLAEAGGTVVTTQAFEGTAGYFLKNTKTKFLSEADADAVTTEWEYFFEAGCDPMTEVCFPANVKKIRQGSTNEGFVETSFTYHSQHKQLETVTPPATGDDLKIRRLYYTAADNGGGIIREGLLKEIQLIEDDAGNITVLDHLRRGFDYDAAGNLTNITDAREIGTGGAGNITQLEWDARGRLIRRTEQIGGSSNQSGWESTLFRYGAPNWDDQAGTESRTPAQDTTVPGHELLQVETGALGATGTTTEGRVQRFLRDSRSRVRQVTRKIAGSFVEFAAHGYDSDENRISTSQPTTVGAQRTFVFGFDTMRRLRTVADDASNLTTFDYDAMGNRTLVSDARDVDTGFVYDEVDRLIRVVQHGEGLTTEFDYDAVGNVTRVTDPKAQRTDYAYDALSRLEMVTQELGIDTPAANDFAVRYAYDDRSRLQKVTNARGQALRYFYFPWGGLERVEHDLDDDGGVDRTVSYTYDFNGNMRATRDSALVTTAGASGSELPAGRLYSFSYDALNRVSDSIAHYVTGAPSIASGFDPAGNRDTMTLSDGHTTSPRTQSWVFDDGSRLAGTCMPKDQPCSAGAETVRFGYLGNDDLASITHGNGAATALSYLPEGPVDVIDLTGPAPAALHKLDYTVDAVLNVTRIEEWLDGSELTSAGQCDPMGMSTAAYKYCYDDTYRLTGAAYPNQFDLPAVPEVFGYDQAGNRDDDPGNGSPWEYDGNNRVVTSPDPGLGDASYASDDDGNLLTRTADSVTRSFSWDVTNRLASVSDSPGGAVASYAHDPFGRRIRKIAGSTTTYYLWDGDQLLAEYDGSGNRKARYAYAGGFAPVEFIDSSGATEVIYAVHTDHLDTPRMLTDSAGQAVWRSGHAAFGASAPDEDPDNNSVDVTFNLRFPGQYFDSETGLHYNRWRYYSPEIGRYVSADPIGQQGGVNTYEYAFSNPLARADLYGLTSIQVNFNAPTTNTSITLGQPSTTRQGVTFDPNSGQVTVTDPNANVTATFPAVSGPHGQGALPPGTYTTAGPVVNIPNTPGNASFCDPSGNCWWQPLTPQFSTPRGQPGNGRFGFHPDGGVPGTSGCIGATQQNTSGAQSALGGLPPGSTVLVLP